VAAALAGGGIRFCLAWDWKGCWRPGRTPWAPRARVSMEEVCMAAMAGREQAQSEAG